MTSVTNRLARVKTRINAIDLFRRLPKVIASIYLLQSTIAVLVLAMLVPPFQNSDEFNHMKRVDQIASGGLIALRYGGPNTSGGIVDTGIDRVDGLVGVIRFHPERKASGEIMRAAGAIKWGHRSLLTFANTSIYAPFLYFPSVIGVLVGKSLSLSVAHTLIVARIINGLASVCIAAVALALSGGLAPLLLVLLTLPMSVSLFASVSQDGMMLALAALAVAMAVKVNDSNMKVNDSNTDRALVPTLVICAALAFVGIGRPAYIPLAATPLLLSTLPLRWRVVGTSAIAVSVLAWSALVSFTSLINTEGHRGVYPLQQLELLFVSPGRIVNLALHVLTQQQGMEGLPFYKEFIGVLGWIDVVLPSWFYPCAVVALSLAILVCAFDGEPLLRPVARLGLCVLLCLSVILIFLLEYLTWTPVGFPVVEGVQGRYFLPLAMFATALAPTRRLQIVSRCCHMVEVFLLLFPALSISVTIATVVRRYYL